MSELLRTELEVLEEQVNEFEKSLRKVRELLQDTHDGLVRQGIALSTMKTSLKHVLLYFKMEPLQ